MITKNPTGILHQPITTVERLSGKFTIMKNGCWLWNKPHGGGYGQFVINGKAYGAHRVVWELCKGKETRVGQWNLDHLCRNRACVNPEHLQEVTMKTNTLKGIGPSAVNAVRTHCKWGHELSGDNLRIKTAPSRESFRQCRTCQLAHMRRSWHKRRAAELERRKETPQVDHVKY